jgi:integrase
VRSGSVFKRCGKCSRRVEGRRCTTCGYEGVTWGFVVDITTKDGQGRLIGPRRQHKNFGFRTKAEAQAALNSLQVKRADGTYVEPARLTLDQYLEQWLPGVRGEVRGSTFATYEFAVRRLKPLIGQVPLQSLTFSQVKAAYQQLAEGEGSGGRKLSPKTVHNTHLCLRRALRDAVRGHLLTHNPAEAAHRLPTDRPEMQFWSAEELRSFLAAIEDHPLYPLLRLAASTGMRRGELLGLRWRDLDLDRARLSVRQQYGRQGQQVVFGSVKTKAGRRSISLDATTVETLRLHREARTLVVAQFGGSYPTHDLVFCHPEGTPFDPDVISQAFDRLVAAFGLRRIRLHDLRHTHATLGLAAGVSVKVMSERLGHSKASVTQDLYQHVIPGMQEDAAARIAAVVDGGL